MKYSSRHDKETLEIYRDIEDKEILKNIDIDIRNIAIALEIRESDEIKAKLDYDKSDVNINVEEIAYKKKLLLTK